MASVYDSFMAQLGMDDEQLEEVQSRVIKGLMKVETNIQIQQLIALTDFEVFKAEMNYQNRLLEMEAFQDLQEEVSDDEEQNYQELQEEIQNEVDEEELNLQLAIMLSFDNPDYQKIQELKQKLESITGNNSGSQFEQKLPQLSQVQQREQQTLDPMGFNVNDNVQEQFENKDTTQLREQVKEEKKKKLQERIAKEEPKIPKEELEKRKTQMAAIKNALNKDQQDA